jgi:hypothetical protein
MTINKPELVIGNEEASESVTIAKMNIIQLRT